MRHGKTEQGSWIPGQGILSVFSDSKRDIARYKNQKKNGS